jgi:hypothetical protein
MTYEHAARLPPFPSAITTAVFVAAHVCCPSVITQTGASERQIVGMKVARMVALADGSS